MKRDYEKELTLAIRDTKRFDAGETDFIVRQLLAVKAKLYQTEYPTLKATSFIPMASDVDAYDEAIVWQMEDQFGAADFVANDADDLPDVDVAVGESTPTPIGTIALQYGYSWLDLGRAAKSKAPLPTRKAMRARKAIAEKIDVTLRSGNASGKIPGFLNNPNAQAPIAAAGNYYDGTGLTATQIAADIDKQLRGIETDTLGIHEANTVLLPLSTYGYLNTTPWNTANATNLTILGWLQEHHPGVTFDKWYALETAGAGGVKRMVVYEKNPDVIEGQLPLDFYELPAQTKGLGIKVPCVARCGGTILRLPKALRYVDGV